MSFSFKAIFIFGFGSERLSLDFEKDPISGWWDIQILIFWGCLPLLILCGRLPLEVIFHWRLSSVGGQLPLEVTFNCSNFYGWFGPLNLSFKFEKDQISGCEENPVLIFLGRLPFEVFFISSNSNFQMVPKSYV
jgi:hypothetical protein